jgi:hypothetical protein
MSVTRRPRIGRVVLGILAVGASLSLTACGQLPLLPPALSGGEEVAPEPVDVETTPETETEPEPVETEAAGPEDTDVFAIALGDCLNEMSSNADDQVSEVPQIDCAEPHDYEVYHVEDIPESGAYPGETSVQESADSMCLEAFDGFVGMPYAESGIDYTPLYPTEEGWGMGDREVLCLAYDLSGQVTGSLAGAAY